MKTTVNLHDFREAFRLAGRENQFSYDGLEALFDYLEQYEEDTGEELELDVVALCCDFAESTDKELIEYYDIDVSDCEDDDEVADTIQEYLEDQGAYVNRVNGGFVYRQF